MDEPRWLDQDEQRTWRAYLHASLLLSDRLDRELQRDAALTHPYYEVLVRLSEAPHRTLRMSELAERSVSSPSRISHAVARLEREGWVRRSKAVGDRRGTLAVLTDLGFATLDAASRSHVASVRAHLFDPLTPEEVQALGRISAKLVDHLGQLDPP